MTIAINLYFKNKSLDVSNTYANTGNRQIQRSPRQGINFMRALLSFLMILIIILDIVLWFDTKLYNII